MVYDYVITLKRGDTKLVDFISYLLYLLSFASFFFFAFSFGEMDKMYLLLAVAIVISGVWIFVRKKKAPKVYFTSGLAIAAIGWFAQGIHHNSWMGILYVVAAIAEREFKFPKEIGFSAQEITLNSLFKKKYDWDSVNNAMIKEGIVTIDLKNNKIIQKEIAEEVAAATEVEFNEFCKQQLKGTINHER